MRDLNTPEQIEMEKISIERRASGIRRFFFGSLPRTMATIIIVFIVVAVINALLAGPAGRNSGKKNVGNKNQSREDIAEANRLLSEKDKADQDKILKLMKENEELKGKGLKEEIKLKSPVSSQQTETGKAEALKQAPVFTSPGDAVNFMAAQEQKKANIPAYQPMQRILPPPELPQVQRAQQQLYAGVSSQENKKDLAKNLLAGSRAQGSLTHGVAAVSGLPYPVVIDLTSASIGPNATSRPIKDCAVIAAASADLSAARVYMQAKTLNCYIGGEYIEQAVDGYIVDLSDGLIGLKGRVDERSGPYIAELILASFAGGISKGLAAGETTTSVSTSTGVVTSSLTGSAMREGLYSGASNAAEKLAQKLEQKADKFMPFVEVKPTDRVQIIFSSGVHIPDDYHGLNMREMTWIK